MHILVAVKRVLDYTIPVRIKKDNSNVDLEHLKMSMNPFDEIALEEAIRLKEKNHAEKITVVSVGNEDTQETLRQALAMGADHAILIQTESALTPLGIAHTLKKIAEKERFDLILLGKQAIDSDDNQVGQMLAGLLDVSQGTFISELNVLDPHHLQITREVDGGLQTLKLNLPAVLTTDLRLNEPRHTSLINIMKAKNKSIDLIPIETLLDVSRFKISIQSVSPAKKERLQHQFKTAKELVHHLKHEQKVIA